MEQPKIEVDAQTYKLVSDYSEKLKDYYADLKKANQKEIDILRSKLRGLERLDAAYNNRIQAADLFLDGLIVLDF